MKPLIKKQAGRVARAYHRLRASALVRATHNRRGAKLLAALGPLPERAAAIVEALRTDGIAVVPVTELITPATFEELRSHAFRRWADPAVQARAQERGDLLVNGKPRSKEYFLVELWEGPHVLDLSHPYLRFSLSDSILRIIGAYLGTLPRFRGWSLQATVPVGEGERRYASQQWHRDPEDRRLVKTFLYLNDVGPDNGPFMYLPGSQEGSRWRSLAPQRPPRGSVARDEDIPLEEARTCVGKAGTLIFCDTSGLHRGGYATEGERLMYTSIYATPASVWPIVFSYGPDPLPENLSPEAAFALANDPRQREPRYYKF